MFLDKLSNMSSFNDPYGSPGSYAQDGSSMESGLVPYGAYCRSFDAAGNQVFVPAPNPPPDTVHFFPTPTTSGAATPIPYGLHPVVPTSPPMAFYGQNLMNPICSPPMAAYGHPMSFGNSFQVSYIISVINT